MLPNRPECSLLLSLLVLPACPGGNDSGELVEDDSTTNADDGSTGDADTSGDPPAEPTDGDASSGGADETGPGTSDCDDQMILDLGLVGRWLGHMPRGRFRHDSIARAPFISGERLIG